MITLPCSGVVIQHQQRGEKTAPERSITTGFGGKDMHQTQKAPLAILNQALAHPVAAMGAARDVKETAPE